MGTLFVVATPIGNLEDISARALRTLHEVSLIAAEDTRHSKRLLSHYRIETPTISYHQHNQRARRDRLLNALASGDVALITDAGTPGISDPGANLVSAALAAGYSVSPIPGPSALAAAASASGLVDGPFVFLGFLPRESSKRRSLVVRTAATGFPFIIFESPHRIRATLNELRGVVGDRVAVALRELTKVHEEVLTGSLLSIENGFAENLPRGEIVLVIGGSEDAAATGVDVTDLVRNLRQGGLSASQAAKEAAVMTGLPRSEMYALAREYNGESVRLKREFPPADKNALQNTLRDQECPD